MKFTANKPLVVCFGDSMTAAGYPAVIEKNLGLNVINAGIGGQSTVMGLERMQSDVLDYRPNVVVILFGGNDSRLAEPEIHVPLEQYVVNLVTMVEACQKIRSQVVFCTIPPMDETAYYTRHNKTKFDAAGGLQVVLDHYRAVQFDVADKYRLPIVDLNAILQAHPEWRDADGVHPTAIGVEIIGNEIGKAVALLLSISTS